MPIPKSMIRKKLPFEAMLKNIKAYKQPYNNFCGWTADKKYLRVSRLYDMCPRQAVYAHQQEELIIDDFNLTSSLYMSTGTFLHEYFQNAVLRYTGVLYGNWKCLKCGHVRGPRHHRIVLSVHIPI